MSILQAIYQFLFGPLELLFEVIYGVAFHIVDGNAGAAVISSGKNGNGNA